MTSFVGGAGNDTFIGDADDANDAATDTVAYNGGPGEDTVVLGGTVSLGGADTKF